MRITHWLNRVLYVWRETSTADGAGGFTITYVNQGSVWVKVDQSTPDERIAAQQSGADHTHNIYAETGTDIRRTDRLADSGVNPNTTHDYYRIIGTAEPSTPIYLKAQAERVEAGP